MGMSTRCVGFRPADELWKRMKTIWDTCDDAGVAVPSEVEAFFASVPPGDKPGQEIPLGDAATQYRGEEAEGYEIDVTKLPPGVQIIRVYNQW